MPQPTAKWNPARDVWETDQACLCGHSDVWSETFPRWAMWDESGLYELPTWAPATGDADASLLPTPTVQDAANTGGPSQFDRHTLPLNTQVLAL